MDLLTKIFIFILILLAGYIVIRIFAYGAAKSVIDAMQQTLQSKERRMQNGIEEKTTNERQVTGQNRTERKDERK